MSYFVHRLCSFEKFSIQNSKRSHLIRQAADCYSNLQIRTKINYFCLIHKLKRQQNPNIPAMYTCVLFLLGERKTHTHTQIYTKTITNGLRLMGDIVCVSKILQIRNSYDVVTNWQFFVSHLLRFDCAVWTDFCVSCQSKLNCICMPVGCVELKVWFACRLKCVRRTITTCLFDLLCFFYHF